MSMTPEALAYHLGQRVPSAALDLARMAIMAHGVSEPLDARALHVAALSVHWEASFHGWTEPEPKSERATRIRAAAIRGYLDAVPLTSGGPFPDATG